MDDIKLKLTIAQENAEADADVMVSMDRGRLKNEVGGIGVAARLNCLCP